MSSQVGGLVPFDVNNFTYPSSNMYEKTYSDSSVEELAKFINEIMRAAAPACGDEACAQDIAAYLWSYRTPPANESEKLQIANLSFDETGLKFDLSCQAGASDVLVKVVDPDAGVDLSTAYSAIISRADGISEVEIESIATVDDNGEIALVGDGKNIWRKEIWFNALTDSVENGNLDLTLNIRAVANVEHEFAKVGILVSSTDDLSGQLLFLHWSGRNGLAEDSGNSGDLDGYGLLLANPNEGQLTPTPTTLRVTYEDGSLKVGGCYNCANPEMKNAARNVNFTPKRVFIVSSSHNAPETLAYVTVTNSHKPIAVPYYEVNLPCGTSSTPIVVPDNLLKSRAQLKLAIYQNGELLTEKVTGKVYSENASCQIQSGLLEPKLRRLSEAQIMNSLRDIFGDIFAEDSVPNMEDGFKLIGMNTLADRLNINAINLERFYDSSREWVVTILSGNNTIKQCAQDSSATCVDTIVADFGEKLWRRPLTPDELTDLASGIAKFSNNQKKLEFALNSLIMSSNFLFRSEIGTAVGEYRQLDNYEIVTLLAYTIWNSTPDQTLLNLARKSSPLTVEELQTQVNRMFADPKANKALVEIYKDYLKLEMGLTVAKAEGLGFTDAIRRELLTSAELMLSDRINGAANYMDVFGGYDFYVSKATQRFFNTTVNSDSLERISLNPEQRYGILSHPIFLAAHSTLDHSGIIKRGVFTLEQFLCESLGAPPTQIDSQEPPPNLDPATTSERELLQATHSSQAACVGCHKFIDPAGFGFENYDAVGRFRIFEKEIVPIDASGTLKTNGGFELTYDNSVEYTAGLVNSERMASCVSRRFLEHYLSQDLSATSCELKKYQTQVNSRGQTVKSLLDSLIQLESFTKRRQVQ